MRPETMRIVEDLRNQNILTLEHARNNNQKVVGMYCAYSPQELVLAAGALPVSLCGTKQEVISLPAQGVGKERIIAGIHRSVASRIAAMAERPGTGRLIAFPGGVSKNGGVQEYLSREPGREIVVAPEAHLARALGAAILARDKCALRS